MNKSTIKLKKSQLDVSNHILQIVLRQAILAAILTLIENSKYFLQASIYTAR